MYDFYCYIDCTNTVNSRHNTGIQRVVRNIIERVPRLANSETVTFIPVIAVGDKFYKLHEAPFGRSKWTKLLIDSLGMLRNILNMIFKKNCVPLNCAVDVFGGDTPPRDLHSRIVVQCRKVIPYMCKLAYIADNIIINGKPVEFRHNDVLFLADTFWKKEVVSALKCLEKSETTKILLIYDVIAATYNNVFDETYVDNFTRCLTYLTKRIDGIITISKASLEEIRNYNADAAPGLLYDYFHLGADFTVSAKIPGNVRKNLPELFAGSAVYLMVGTIEPRKNHTFVLDAFEYLWSKGSPVCLCIVGREGWMCDDVLGRVARSPYLGTQLYYFKDLNDDELEYCYGGSKALVIASTVEGFGLPLVEAMHHGKPVFASDIPVFREIGEDYPIYFDLEDSKALADYILDYENNVLERQFRPKEWLTWDESIEDLFAKVTAMARNEGSVNLVQPDCVGGHL